MEEVNVIVKYTVIFNLYFYTIGDTWEEICKKFNKSLYHLKEN